MLLTSSSVSTKSLLFLAACLPNSDSFLQPSYVPTIQLDFMEFHIAWRMKFMLQYKILMSWMDFLQWVVFCDKKTFSFESVKSPTCEEMSKKDGVLYLFRFFQNLSSKPYKSVTTCIHLSKTVLHWSTTNPYQEWIHYYLSASTLSSFEASHKIPIFKLWS